MYGSSKVAYECGRRKRGTKSAERLGVHAVAQSGFYAFLSETVLQDAPADLPDLP